MRIRPFAAGDKAAVMRIVRETGFFRDDEVVAAEEVLDDCLTAPGEQYHTYLAVDDGDAALGYVCFGLRPLTLGTWDLYWIAVDPKRQTGGVGRKLMTFAEGEIKKRGGYQVLVETSAQPMYKPSLAFYRAVGYEEAAEVPDFYAPGDGLVIFRKRLSS